MRAADTNHRNLGILWIIYGVISLAQAAWVFFNMPALTVMWGAVITRVPNPFVWMDWFHIVIVGVIGLAVVSGIFSFLAGFSLLGASESSRWIVVAASILALLRGPLGIAIGVYTLVVAVRGTAADDYRLPAAA